MAIQFTTTDFTRLRAFLALRLAERKTIKGLIFED